MKPTNNFRLHRVALAVSAIASASAFAQSSPPAPEQSLERITITATKREVLLTDAPLSIQAISAEKLRNEGVVSMSDIVQVVPGTSQTFKAAPGFEVLQVRGISSGAVGDSLVGYYIDEIPFGLPNVQYIPPVNLFDLSRVEVLRGPQGTLYGQSSMGGAIRMITRKPDLQNFGGEVRLGYANVDGGSDGKKVDLVLNVPVQTDTFAVRLSGGTSDEGSYIADGGRSKNDNLRLKGLVQVNQDLSIEGTIWGVKSRQDGYAYGKPASPYVTTIAPNEPHNVDTDVKLGNLTVNYATAIGDLVSSTSYMDHQFKYKFSLPGLRDYALLPGSGGWLSDSTVTTSSRSQEVRLASRPGGAIDWIGGLFLQDSKISSDTTQGWANYAAFNFGPTVWTQGTGDLTSKSYGLFGEISDSYMSGKLVPTLGARAYHDVRTAHDLRDGKVTDATRTFDSVNPRFNLAYKPSTSEMYYMNIAKGFRSGALQGQAAVTAANAAGLPAEPLMPQDSLWSYEGGFKSDISRSVAIEVALYQIDWKDAQINSLLIGANGVTTSVVSGGMDVQGRGIDFGINWAAPVNGLSFQLAGNVNATEYTRVPKGIKAQVGDQISGSPKKSATVAMNYRTTVAGLKVYTNLSYNFRDAQTEMVTGAASDSIRDLRARVGVSGKNWDASLYGQNLTNQQGIAAVLSSLVVNPIQPRKIGVDLSFKF